jgi:hypothetical protein
VNRSLGRVLSVAIRVLSAAIAAAGGVLVLLAFTTLDWYAEPLPDSHGNSHGGASFADLRWLVAYASWAPPLATAYFRWLGWAVLIATLALGLMVTVRPRGRLRWAAPSLALLGAVLTLAALFDLYDPSNEDTATVFTTAEAGIYCAVGGFILVGIGTALAALRATAPQTTSAS